MCLNASIFVAYWGVAPRDEIAAALCHRPVDSPKPEDSLLLACKNSHITFVHIIWCKHIEDILEY